MTDKESLIERLVETVENAIVDPAVSIEEVEILGQIIGGVALGEIKVKECKHEMIARFTDGTAHCESCGASL